MLMSNTIRARNAVPFRRCDWCGAQGVALLILPSVDGSGRLKCAYRCRHQVPPVPVDQALVPARRNGDGWFDQRNTAPDYCNWCGGRFYQWVRTWSDSLELDMPHCGRCVVPWGEDFAYAERDYVHRHEYHYSKDWGRDSVDYFEDTDPVAELLKAGVMHPEGMYCMEVGMCDRRFLSVVEFVGCYGVMGRWFVFQKQMNDLDWSAQNSFADLHCWDFRPHQSAAPHFDDTRVTTAT